MALSGIWSSGQDSFFRGTFKQRRIYRWLLVIANLFYPGVIERRIFGSK
ncbi:hypothetical protein HMPREF9103_01059 [Lentilactobacillus parafarraginis F0439]|uniref:Uncharacterized protein n=1 Tax=Lentilactobacillus parafarraginis F0439 TaxID=797515 RepID=G9ZMV9_9LACO|nr:hypothetical protein HMPREF9103_01059 [Lentilactobacillus parafarraginis F0439]